MSKKSLLSGREKKLQELAGLFEEAKAMKKSIYMDAEDLTDLADWYMSHRNSRMATEVAEYGLSLHPANTDLMVERAYLYLDSKQWKEAKSMASQIVEDTPEVKVLRANILMGDEKTAEAEALLDTIEDKHSLPNVVDIAYMYIDTGYTDKAAEWLAIHKEEYMDEEPFLAVCGDCYFALEELDKAIYYYNKAIDLNPYYAAYWGGLARCYYDRQQYDKAIEACDYAIIGDSDYTEAYIILGDSYYQLGNEERSLENYLQAQKLGALTDTFIDTFKGLSKTSKGEWEEGLRYWEKVLTSNNYYNNAERAAIYSNAALCLYMMGDFHQAHLYCQKSRDLAHTVIDSYLLEGRIYIEEGDHKAGINLWKIALIYAPQADTWFDIGENCLEICQFRYAKIAFERVKKLDPNYADINEKLTSTYLLLRDKNNFERYNQLCKHPIQTDMMDKLQEIMQTSDKDALAELIKNIYESLK